MAMGPKPGIYTHRPVSSGNRWRRRLARRRAVASFEWRRRQGSRVRALGFLLRTLERQIKHNLRKIVSGPVGRPKCANRANVNYESGISHKRCEQVLSTTLRRIGRNDWAEPCARAI